MARVYDRFLRQRLTRRRILQGTGVAAAGAASIALVGCGGGGSEPSGSTTPGADEGEPLPGGILRLRQSAAYPNFNPFGSGLAALAQGLFTGFTVFDHLWYVPTDTGEVVMFLATNIETIDAQTISVTLGDAVFHDKPPVDGRAVRSRDLKASLEKFREQVPFGFSWLREVFERMDTPDDKTAVYHQNKPWSWFFTSSNAGSPWTSSIVPEETLDMEDLLNDDPIGSGKWVMAGHDAGANVKQRKFENWREPGLPFLDGIDYILATDETLAQAAFAAKDLDSIGGLDRIEQQDLIDRFGDEIVPTGELSRSYGTIMLKNIPPFDNPEVRHAINLAINREELRQVIHLGDGEFCGPLPPAHVRYVLDDDDPDLQEYFRHDLEEAKRRLEEAAFPFEREFTLKYHNFGNNVTTQAEVLASQLRAVGMKINLPGAEDISSWLANTLGAGDFEMTAFFHLPYEDPSLPLSFYAAPNQMGYEDAEVEAAFLAVAAETDQEAQIEATKEAQRILIRKWAPMLNFYSPITHGARWSYLKGVVDGRGSFGTFNSRAWLDK